MALVRTAYFGGSFDPPHNGHIALARAVVELDLADEVWLSAAYIPPHKQRRLSDFADRMAMLKLACRGLKQVFPCGIEDELKLNPSYTSEVLAELRRRYEFSSVAQCRRAVAGLPDYLLSAERWRTGVAGGTAAALECGRGGKTSGNIAE